MNEEKPELNEEKTESRLERLKRICSQENFDSDITVSLEELAKQEIPVYEKAISQENSIELDLEKEEKVSSIADRVEKSKIEHKADILGKKLGVIEERAKGFVNRMGSTLKSLRTKLDSIGFENDLTSRLILSIEGSLRFYGVHLIHNSTLKIYDDELSVITDEADDYINYIEDTVNNIYMQIGKNAIDSFEYVSPQSDILRDVIDKDIIKQINDHLDKKLGQNAYETKKEVFELLKESIEAYSKCIGLIKNENVKEYLALYEQESKYKISALEIKLDSLNKNVNVYLNKYGQKLTAKTEPENKIDSGLEKTVEPKSKEPDIMFG
ncbi:MAG: hypothetical protein PHC66_02070 [Candidatus Nanoarchaeia archaeon]|nr:hypothetical protein [Candidatus Nanoarchaeia archaeon]MDD5239738.1 hypothetical protein [Candidatus Nanoarchaeia archaeon]